MYLYALTLQRAGGILQAVYGNFSAPKAQEIAIGHGKVLELLRYDQDMGKLVSVYATEIFGLIRSLQPFRLTGANRDYLIVGSDSGRITILEFNATKNQFEKVQQETFGKSGCRRIVPGQTLAADPRGRAVMIGAVEKQKLVYVLNRDAHAKLTISSPLEAHKSHTITFAYAGLDVGFENPVFAALEVDYGDIDQDITGEALRNVQKHLTYYELDLGLNHVVRKLSDAVDNSAHLLITVPGGTEGPGGLLVCCQNWLLYRNQGQPELKVRIPRRNGYPADQNLMIVCYATHKQKDMFFFLLQSELGDLYKVKLLYTEERVQRIHMKYFDTVPVASSLCVLKTGQLFVASEFGNHPFYQFQSIGDEDEGLKADGMDTGDSNVFFDVQPLRYLTPLDELESMSPIMDMKVVDLLREDQPQIYTACGRGSRSTLRILRHGLPATEFAQAQTPANPLAVWTLQQSYNAEHDKYFVLSFVNATVVLEIGDKVEKLQDAERIVGIAENTPTILAALLTDSSLVQVHATAVRHVRGPLGNRQISEWKVPPRRTILHASSNGRQLIIALQGGDIYYFALDPTGQLLEIEKRETNKEVSAVDLAPVEEGRTMARFAAIGEVSSKPDGSADANVRILSLDHNDNLKSVAMQALLAPAESLGLIEVRDVAGGASTLQLSIGLRNGVLLRTNVDKITGELADTRTRFLGARAVRLRKVRVGQGSAILALSSRTWIYYHLHGRPHLVPISYTPFDHAAQLNYHGAEGGLVGIAGNTLRIITLDRLGDTFNQASLPLRYTPRGMAVHTPTSLLAVVEGDPRATSVAVQLGDKMLVKPEPGQPSAEQQQDERNRLLNSLKGPVGSGAGCVRLVSPALGRTLDVAELEQDETALAVCCATFTDHPEEQFIVVSGAKGVRPLDRKAEYAFFSVYQIVDEGQGAKLRLLHKTLIDELCYVIAPFQGRLLAGVGHTIRIYDLGKRKMLRKTENKNIPNFIKTIHTEGDRIIVGDVSESFHFCKYKRPDQIIIFADDYTSRWLTAGEMVDYDTMVAADKFGNLSVVRLPAEVSEDVEEDPTGARFKWEQGALNGAPYKLANVAQFHVGETVMKVQKAALMPGGHEALLYATVLGGIGALMPFTSREDVDFFAHLEMALRQENPPMMGRDHLGFRGAYTPVKNVLDGDLCEQYGQLEPARQRAVASELDRTPAEIAKKLEDIRNKIL